MDIMPHGYVVNVFFLKLIFFKKLNSKEELN